MIRLAVREGTLNAGDTITLDPEESHHLTVRRASDEDPVALLDGRGTRATGRLRREGSAWRVAVDRVERAPAPPETVLAVAAGDRDRFFWILEKAAELGVTRVVPLETERTAGVASRYRDAMRAKGARRIQEAGKQSANPWFPLLDPLTPLAGLQRFGTQLTWWLADPAGDAMPSLAGEAVGWLVGPEGGFSADEHAWLRDALAARAIRLGPHLLRFETAAVAAAAVTAFTRRHHAQGGS